MQQSDAARGRVGSGRRGPVTAVLLHYSARAISDAPMGRGGSGGWGAGRGTGGGRQGKKRVLHSRRIGGEGGGRLGVGSGGVKVRSWGAVRGARRREGRRGEENESGRAENPVFTLSSPKGGVRVVGRCATYRCDINCWGRKGREGGCIG